MSTIRKWGKSDGRKIPDVWIRIVLVLYQDGIPRDGRDDWVHSSWSSSSSQMGAICKGMDKPRGLVCDLRCNISLEALDMMQGHSS